MSGKLKINVVIAGRNYPLSVKNTQEEEGMRKAASSINQLISLYEQNYAVNDKQDVLAMCALRFASQLEIANLDSDVTQDEALKKINDLNVLLQKHLE
ncbi:cell division protein ZapA [Polaribacter pacificus]|uniref:Cell division protein ZapA n=1 Tax=Polaribacter pacificus TaxID=1775173 RepID=A0A917I0D7_9FLAO|nr:cell division protein ZapA [Polaribacter pacificus]GGG99639.1 cell division protein ZapA [Polaribacter pacificus]